MVVNGESAFLGDAVLPLLDFAVQEFLYLAALQADQVVVVVSLVEFKNRLVAVEVVAHQQSGLLELGQHAVNRGEADFQAFVGQQAIDFLGRHVSLVALLEQIENLQTGEGGLETDALEIGWIAQWGSRLRTRIRYDTFFFNCPNLSGFLAMRQILISTLLLGLIAGCSGVNIGPHRIDVQQGNALDQENVARLKPGLSRSQVRFLLGTPLVVDPFRTDRWDYVYVYYKAGKLAEQKRITLFFDGDTLARIEGDLPEPKPVEPVPTPGPESAPKVEATPAPTPKVESTPAPAAARNEAVVPAAAASSPVVTATAPVAQPMAVAAAETAPAPQVKPAAPKEVAPKEVVAPASKSVSAAPVAAAVAPVVAQQKAPVAEARRETVPQTSVVAPLPSPKGVPPYVDPRRASPLGLQAETDVQQIKPDVIPAFPEPKAAPAGDEAVLKALNDWAAAWVRRDEVAYLAAYDDAFVPQGGGSRIEWEKRRRMLLAVARNVEVKIESPSVDRDEEGTATVTFNQTYRSDSYRDAVVKQMVMVERGGRWLILEEKILSIRSGTQK